MGYAFDDEDPQIWIPGQPFPSEFLDRVKRGEDVCAWNSYFEMVIWNLVLKRDPIPFNQWNDTMALAGAHALPLALAKCGEVLGLSEEDAKNKRGKLLIQRLSKPQRDGTRNTDPFLLEEFYDYCKQDVAVERTIRKKLRNLTTSEQQIFKHDQELNWRGLKLDTDSIDHALRIYEETENKLNEEVKRITNGELDSTSSRAKAFAWMATKDYQMESYTASAVQEAIDSPACPKIVKRFLKIRQQLSQTSNKKYHKMKDTVASDGRVHGLVQYHGASTGRWAGRLIQPQNLPRPKHKNVDELIDSMPENFKGMDVQPLDALTSCLRGMIVASPGNRLICADFSSIEARVLAWMADHGRVVMSFVEGKDIYRTTAAEMYSTPYSEITDEQRFLGKVATLALGYQGGERAFTKMAQAYGAFIDQELALRIRDYWREANKPIVNLWAEFERSAKRSLWTDGLEKTKVGPFKVHKSELLFRLPSDRVLVWQNPRLEINEKGWEQLRFDGTDPRTRKWTTRDTYGGDLVQSVTQAIARDLLAEAVLRLEEAGYPVVMHIHDEIIADVPKGFGSLKEFIKIMCELPTWAKGLPMQADGFETQRYRK